MGQIVGLKAKPKRCNLNKLSQLGTPAAGEYILVSYDNSMTANGQGNFDRYIIGDGRTAATALELKYLDDSTRPYIVEEVNKAVADIQPIEITGDVTNAPDEEDLTSENQGGTDVLKFKDKAYNSALYSGLGRVYLRKNIVTLEGVGKNVLTQAMVNTANTIYHIQYDYDLNGQTITLPAGCVLKFDGGSLANGYLNLNNAELRGDVNITAEPAWDETNEFWEEYKPSNLVLNVSWFDAKGDGISDDAPAIQRAIKWLHKVGSTLVFEKDKTYILGDGVSTGYSYPNLHPCLSQSNYDNFSTNFPGVSMSDYLAANPADIGRDISLTFFRFSNLSIVGNGSTIKSHPDNGYCWHNRLIFLTGCQNCRFSGLKIDANRGNRSVSLSTPYLSDYNTGNVASQNPSDYDSMYDMLHESRTWKGITMQNGKISGFRNVDNFYCIYSKNVVIENSESTNGLMDGFMITALSDGITVDSCKINHNARHGVALGSTNNCALRNCTFEYAGYVDLGGTETQKYCGGSAHVDMECESTTIIANNNRVEGCTFNIKAYNTFVVSRRHHSALIKGNKFITGWLNMSPMKNCLSNEVCDNVFMNGFLTLFQEGSYIHDNEFTINVPVGSSASYLDISNYEKVYNADYVSSDTYEGQDFPASIIPTRFERNSVTLEFPDGLTQYYRFYFNDNIIVKDNVFKNLYYGNASWNRFFAKEFVNNSFVHDTITYPTIANLGAYPQVSSFGYVNSLIENDNIRNTNITTHREPLFTKVKRLLPYGTSQRYLIVENVSVYGELEIRTDGANNAQSFLKRRYYIFGSSYAGSPGTSARSVFFKDDVMNPNTLTCQYSSSENKLYIDLSSIALIGFKVFVELTYFAFVNTTPVAPYISFASSAPTLSGTTKNALSLNEVADTAPTDTTLLKRMYVNMFDKTTNNKVQNVDGTVKDVYGFQNKKHRGATSDRPTLSVDDGGFMFYDSTIGKMILWNGSAWVNMDGSALS